MFGQAAPRFYIYDLETLLNFFSFTGCFEDSEDLHVFEISDRKNDRDALLAHLSQLQADGVIMVGYNNLGFDYPIIHDLLVAPYTFDFTRAYQLCQQIINSQNAYGRGNHMIRMKDRLIQQLDLMKINHFDNMARRTSLKSLQFAMRSESVEDIPVPLGVPLTHEQMDQTLFYNAHDVTETKKFFKICKPLIKMRQDLLADGVLFGDVLNYSDVKIGEEYLVKMIGRGKCYANGKPIQTYRTKVDFKNIILPKIYFRTEEFHNVHEWFKQQSVWLSGDSTPKLETYLAGIKFKFGVGGVHASVENKAYRSNESHIIRDVDVSGMYVAVAIANGFYPEHLGQAFVTAYKQIQSDRAKYPKGSTLNKVLKLAGNGVYGKSNNEYSPVYDPQYTYTVTVNGQLQLCQLAELLSLIPGLELIQANTDGVTAYLPREVEWLFDLWCKEWEKMTNLKLEHVNYSKMFIRDVNNYICEKEDGSIKAKGAYFYPKRLDDYEGYWNKDYSAMAVQKTIERVLIYGDDPKQALRCITDPYDFMLRYKTTGSAKIYIGDEIQQKTVRYYVAHDGEKMKKVDKPKGPIGQFKRKNGIKDSYYQEILSQIGVGVHDERIHTKNKSVYAEVVQSIESGRRVKECNQAVKFNWKSVDYDYYVQEVKKLVVGNV